jgi:putative membrane protein
MNAQDPNTLFTAPDSPRDRAARRAAMLIALVSSLALGLLFYLIYGRESSGEYAGSVAFLPAMNAACNAITTALIVLGLRAIRRDDREAHRRHMLSASALPMVLGTFWLALTRRFAKHRALARWTYPIWLYVSATGVVIFFVLRAYTRG